MNYIFITMEREHHKNLFCVIFWRFIFWWPLTCYKPTDKLFNFFHMTLPSVEGISELFFLNLCFQIRWVEYFFPRLCQIISKMLLYFSIICKDATDCFLFIFALNRLECDRYSLELCLLFLLTFNSRIMKKLFFDNWW